MKRIALLAALLVAGLSHQNASAYIYQISNATNKNIYVTLDYAFGTLFEAREVGPFSTRRIKTDDAWCISKVSVGFNRNDIPKREVTWVNDSTQNRIAAGINDLSSSVQEAGTAAKDIPKYGDAASAGGKIVGSVLQGGTKLGLAIPCGNAYLTVYEENGQLKVVGNVGW